MMFLAISAMSQDERDFRKMIVGDTSEADENTKIRTFFKVSSPVYKIDLTDDRKAEIVHFTKKDGQDRIHIKDHNELSVFKYKFEPKGAGSHFVKLKIRRLSNSSKVIIIYYYEGYNEHLNFKATGRLYFLTIDDNDLETISIYKGPYFWDESRNYRGSYYRRMQKVDIHDFNGDGIKDISVYHKDINRVYLYRKGNNKSSKWISVNKIPK